MLAETVPAHISPGEVEPCLLPIRRARTRAGTGVPGSEPPPKQCQELIRDYHCPASLPDPKESSPGELGAGTLIGC